MSFWFYASVSIAVLIVVLVTLWIRIADSGTMYEKPWWVSISGGVLIGAALYFVLGAGFVQSVSEENRVSAEPAWTENLVALSNGSNISGSFFLGAGYIGTNQVYSFVTGNDKTGYILDQVYAEDTRVFYTDGSPHLDAYTYGCKKGNWWPDWCMLPSHTYRVYVPRNSIVQNFSIDVRK